MSPSRFHVKMPQLNPTLSMLCKLLRLVFIVMLTGALVLTSSISSPAYRSPLSSASCVTVLSSNVSKEEEHL